MKTESQKAADWIDTIVTGTLVILTGLALLLLGCADAEKEPQASDAYKGIWIDQGSALAIEFDGSESFTLYGNDIDRQCWYVRGAGWVEWRKDQSESNVDTLVYYEEGLAIAYPIHTMPGAINVQIFGGGPIWEKAQDVLTLCN